MSVPKSRLLDLMKLQCTLFSQTFNPSQSRTGSRILRQRLRGPSTASYYPRRLATVKDLKKAFSGFEEGLETWDDFEEDRLERVANAKMRGKGAPKKKRSREDSKKRGRKRPAVGGGEALRREKETTWGAGR